MPLQQVVELEMDCEGDYEGALTIDGEERNFSLCGGTLHKWFDFPEGAEKLWMTVGSSPIGSYSELLFIMAARASGALVERYAFCRRIDMFYERVALYDSAYDVLVAIGCEAYISIEFEEDE